MNLILFAIGLAVIISSLLSLKHDVNFFREFRKRLRQKYNYTPFASVIAPVKGKDDSFNDALHSVLTQDYPKYEVIFVADSFHDNAYKEIKNAIKNRKNTHAVISKPIKTCSGKIAALIKGVEKAKGEILVFIDMDSVPNKKWLRNLVGPLKDKSIGVTTGYRFYVPSKSFASFLRSAWNNIGLLQMFGRFRFVWGGAVGIRKKLFYELDVKSKWLHALSDDSVISDVMKKKNYEIYFVPACLMTSHGNTNFCHTEEFATRQIKIVKTYFRHTWLAAAAIFFAIKFVLISGVILVVSGLLGYGFLIEGLMMLFMVPVILIKNNLAYSNYKNYIKEDIGSRCKYILAGFLASWITVISIIKSAASNEIVWRGRRYKMHGIYDIEVLGEGN